MDHLYCIIAINFNQCTFGLSYPYSQFLSLFLLSVSFVFVAFVITLSGDFSSIAGDGSSGDDDGEDGKKVKVFLIYYNMMSSYVN
jgi:hypothetical protein